MANSEQRLIGWSKSANQDGVLLDKVYVVDHFYGTFKDENGNYRDTNLGVWESPQKPEYPIQTSEEDKVAMRFNAGKPELSYLLSAPYAIEGLAEVFAFGAIKYARDNWKKGLPQEQVCDSLLRHLTSYMNGEELDQESGQHHLNHVLWNALVMADQGNGKRPQEKEGE